jgi:hypothetical protein
MLTNSDGMAEIVSDGVTGGGLIFFSSTSPDKHHLYPNRLIRNAGALVVRESVEVH